MAESYTYRSDRDCNQALPLLSATGDKVGEATVLSNIAYVEGSKGNLQSALTNIEAAIAIIEDLRTELKDTNLRTSYFATQQYIYSFYIDLLMQVHQKILQTNAIAKASSCCGD